MLPLYSEAGPHGLGALGGLDGRNPQAGDILPAGDTGVAVSGGRSVPPGLRRSPGSLTELRTITGLYWHRIADDSKRNFLEGTWVVAVSYTHLTLPTKRIV